MTRPHNTVREALKAALDRALDTFYPEDGDLYPHAEADALAALDELVAERDEWKATAEEVGGELRRANELRGELQAERDRLVTLIEEAIPVVDELCAWIDTNICGCLEVQERGEAMLQKLRRAHDALANRLDEYDK